MKSTVLTLLFLSLLIGKNVSAQYNNIGIGAEINVPSGNSSNISAIGFGGGLKAEIGLSNKFALTAHGSWVSFLGRNYFGVTTAAETSVPVKAGLKYYPSQNFYFEGQLGANLALSGNGSTGFAWSPGFGTFIKMGSSDHKLDVGLRYEGWSSSRVITGTNSVFSTFGFIGLRAAYAFAL